MGQVTKVWLCCYLVLLSDSRTFVTWSIYLSIYVWLWIMIILVTNNSIGSTCRSCEWNEYNVVYQMSSFLLNILSVYCAYSILRNHYSDVIMGTAASQITSLTIVYSNVYSGSDQRKHQSSASLAFVRGIHRWPVNSPHKWPVTRKMLPFDDVIMILKRYYHICSS